MTLAPDFQFSQSSLQDYLDCQRRFELRYLRRQAWPAVEIEPIFDKEAFMRQGATFHRMVHQFLIGLPAEKLLHPNAGDDLRLWWQNFLAFGLKDLPDTHYPEILLSYRVAGQPLVARYDLIAIEPGKRAVIVDWKTSRKHPSRARLLNRLQTRVYRYMLVQAGARLNGGQLLRPEQIEMRYWFAGDPQQPEIFPYDAKQFREDENFLIQLIAGLKAQTEKGSFPLTSDERRCRFCSYRSLCGRGEQAGNVEDSEFFLLDDPGMAFEDAPITYLEF